MNGKLRWGTRAQHIEAVRERALAELEPGGGGWASALNSVASDLTKHPETQHHPAILRGTTLAMCGEIHDDRTAREWINGIS